MCKQPMDRTSRLSGQHPSIVFRRSWFQTSAERMLSCPTFLWFSSVSPGICRDITLNLASASSFHDLYSSLFFVTDECITVAFKFPVILKIINHQPTTFSFRMCKADYYRPSRHVSVHLFHIQGFYLFIVLPFDCVQSELLIVSKINHKWNKYARRRRLFGNEVNNF
jgi:hypothetical protein